MPAKRLLLVFGGRSSEHEISLRSATEVLAALDHARFTPVLLGIRRDGGWRTGSSDTPLAGIISDGEPVHDLRALAPDLVFPVLHGPHGEDGSFQGLLEVLGLPYVGSGVLASALCMDKALIKHVLHHQDPPVAVVPWIELHADALETLHERQRIVDRAHAELGFPCFVKPANQGSSVGVSKAGDHDELIHALQLAARYDSKILIEKAVDAREVELSILGNGDDATIVSGLGEIGLPPGEWYDYDNKYLKDTATLQIPANLPPELAARMQAMALRAYRIAGCKGLARVDFLIDRPSMEPYLNEINTMPGFTSISMYPKLLGHMGIGYTEVLTKLCELALTHHAERQRLSVTR
ncbi:D-alanine--D-alanine ligase family protein [Nannocystis sp.]|uniref:D-alanine--D-alanine ligase family protein n=1 Tax=Nannocystis sp. TaxID=1962667 RepID=UPI00242502E9|nr:D-alanine--D-alanine ligase family protein [Nannocystis sp.]MBK7828890.1 D-alanine--D-alanine ligase [Nannocystis sp.]MBK9756598.1 D-alanine--D-alanine ligase [Nannocystis sp.]